MKRHTFYYWLIPGLIWFLSIGTVAPGETETGDSDKRDDTEIIMKESIRDDEFSIGCAFPLPGSRPVTGTYLPFSHRTSHSNTHDIVPDPGENPENDSSSPDILMIPNSPTIVSEEEYVRIFGGPSRDIDWDTMRVLVCENSRCSWGYNSGSETHLSGIYIYGDILYVVTTTTHYGPCQGIHQDVEMFSFESELYFIVIPRFPEIINKVDCSVGGCPPDIP